MCKRCEFEYNYKSCKNGIISTCSQKRLKFCIFYYLYNCIKMVIKATVKGLHWATML